ncbi:L-histidine N(alpha)-methyltransferase [Methylopila musalis]|uniref:L-histidine N(Alpha)-methyltransferase n=1 Tax=Methylopila musalis TaxID=1134781 RepID=A0ABW3Z9V7_9HYPH
MLDRVPLHEIQREAFRADVRDGLAAPAKRLPSRWLYDDRGSELFEEITRLPEYYPTRTETRILEARAEEIAAFCGPRATVVEYGAGAGVKTALVLAALDNPAVYVPIDIAGDFLELAAARLSERFPWLEIRPVTADFTAELDLPDDLPRLNARIGFFPGSTIGNLSEGEARTFLRRMRGHLGSQGKAIIGVDLRKDLGRLLPAYDDAAGVTAAFNLNLLTRINRELEGGFDLARFAHEARWNDVEGAVEMHAVSLADQTVAIGGDLVAFARGETIHTESSRKYSPEAFDALAAAEGWAVTRLWTDEDRLFAVMGLEQTA